MSAIYSEIERLRAENERLRSVDEAYEACVSVARKRLDNIAPDMEAALPGLCQIDRATWLIHKERAPIIAMDMLEHAKLKAAEARAASAEAKLAVMDAALEEIERDPNSLAVPGIIRRAREARATEEKGHG